MNGPTIWGGPRGSVRYNYTPALGLSNAMYDLTAQTGHSLHASPSNQLINHDARLLYGNRMKCPWSHTATERPALTGREIATLTKIPGGLGSPGVTLLWVSEAGRTDACAEQ